MPFTVTENNQFADLTEEEFISKFANGAVVPEAVMSPSDAPFSSKVERVDFLDKPSAV